PTSSSPTSPRRRRGSSSRAGREDLGQGRVRDQGHAGSRARGRRPAAAAPGPRPIQDIAGRQDIPQRYLEQVLLGLTRAGLLVSKRGSAGGYRLARGGGHGPGGGGVPARESG